MSSIFGPEVTPVALEPEQAFEQGMSQHDYLKLEHGKLHNARYRRFRELVAKRRAASVTDAHAPATRSDIALLAAVLYGHHIGYVASLEDQKQADGYASVITAMGGKL